MTSKKQDAPKDKPDPAEARTAIIFVHGQGEQTPMKDLQELVHAVWETDESRPDLISNDERVSTTHPDCSVWNIPNFGADLQDIRRLTTDNYKCSDGRIGRLTFFDFYWADLIRGSRWSHISSWIAGCLRIPQNATPPHMRSLRNYVYACGHIMAFWILLFILISALIMIGLNADHPLIARYDDMTGLKPTEKFGIITGLILSALWSIVASVTVIFTIYFSFVKTARRQILDEDKSAPEPKKNQNVLPMIIVMGTIIGLMFTAPNAIFALQSLMLILFCGVLLQTISTGDLPVIMYRARSLTILTIIALLIFWTNDGVFSIPFPEYIGPSLIYLYILLFLHFIRETWRFWKNKPDKYLIVFKLGNREICIDLFALAFLFFAGVLSYVGLKLYTDYFAQNSIDWMLTAPRVYMVTALIFVCLLFFLFLFSFSSLKDRIFFRDQSIMARQYPARLQHSKKCHEFRYHGPAIAICWLKIYVLFYLIRPYLQ